MFSDAPLPDLTGVRIAVIGLGYVGLSLAVEFGKQFPQAILSDAAVVFDVKGQTEPDGSRVRL